MCSQCSWKATKWFLTPITVVMVCSSGTDTVSSSARIRALQEFADKHNVEVRREGGSKALRMYRPDGKWRTVVDFKTNSVPQGVRDRAFEEWEQIIIDNALLLNAD